LRQLCLDVAEFAVGDAFLFARLTEFLLADVGLGARLVERLAGNEVLFEQIFGTFQLLSGEGGAGFGGLDVGVGFELGFGDADGGAFRLRVQHCQDLAFADPVAAFDGDRFDDADHLAADFGRAFGFDQAAERLCRAGRRAERAGESQCEQAMGRAETVERRMARGSG